MVLDVVGLVSLSRMAPMMARWLSLAAHIISVTLIRSPLVRPSLSMIAVPDRQLWQPVSAIVSAEIRRLLVSSVSPRPHTTGGQTQWCGLQPGWGLDCRLNHNPDDWS